MDAEPPLNPLSLTPEERESAAAYLRTTFRLHPIEPEEPAMPPVAPVAPIMAVAKVPIVDESPTVKFVLLKKDRDPRA